MVVSLKAAAAAAKSKNGPKPTELNALMGTLTSVFVPLGSIEAWPGNPRRHFPAEDLQDLATSIKANGVLQPLLVRESIKTTRSWAKLYELADGERRFRASKLAGLKEVPVLIAELTEEQMLAIALTTREQSRDLTVLERADAMRRLVEEHGLSIEDVAKQIGKSSSTVRNLLLLPRLPAIAKAAAASGHLPAATAMLIARVPGEASRTKLALEVLAGDDYYADHKEAAAEVEERIKQEWPPLSYRETKELIEQHYMVELKRAAFSRKSLDLVPAAGSCEECPKRAGNNPEEFAGVRADMCTDPDCFQRKTAAHWQHVRERAEKTGETIISGAEAEKIISYGSHPKAGSGYYSPDQTCWEDKQRRSFQELIGKDHAVLASKVLVMTKDGSLHPLYKEADVKAALKAKGIKVDVKAALKAKGIKVDASNGARFRKEQANHRKKMAAGKKAAELALGIVAERIGDACSAVGYTSQAIPLFQTIVGVLAEAVWNDLCRLVARRHKLDTSDPVTAIKSLAGETKSMRELLALIAELAMSKKTSNWGVAGTYEEKDVKDVWGKFGVDPAKLMKQVDAPAKTKAKV